MTANHTSDSGRDHPDDALFKQYWEHASALRSWFVIYGLGGIALFLTEAEAVAGFSPLTKVAIMGGFMLAVVAQVTVAFINKWTHWSAYWGDESTEFRGTYRYKLATKLSKRVWIDFTFDLISLVSALFAIASLIYAIAATPAKPS